MVRKGPRSRRKGAAPIRPNQTAPERSEVSPGPMNNHIEREGKQEVVVTETEAHLTAKNYRLAKELSELRQKLKDETKTVTNLTMQNMNLASRCRQALNHVEALRKELSKYQQQEISSNVRIHSQQQPQPQQQSNYSVDVEGTTRKDEERVFGRTLASPNFAPQDNLENQALSMGGGKISMSMSNESNNENRLMPMVEESEEILQNSVNSTSRVDADRPYNLAEEDENHELVDKAAMQGVLSTPSPVTPETDEETVSPPDYTGGDFDNEISEDVVGFGELQSGDYFHQSYESSLPATPEKENGDVDVGVDVDALNEDFDSFGISNKETEGQSDNHSTVGIDAFDASFQTTFPSSFADNVSPSHFGTSEFSDSFFMETTPTPGSGKKKKQPTKDDERHIDPTIDTFSDEIDAPMDEAMELFPSSAMSAFETFDTPPSKSTNSASNRSVSLSSARARFERRNRKHADSPADAPMDEAEVDSAEHSPTLVLKRLQQRKSKGGLPSPNPNAKSSISITEEIRKLDAIATGATGASLTSSREKQPRRSASTPTSYAEPSLKSKLRRGDVYFPKDNSVSPHKLPKPVAEEGTGMVDWQLTQSSATS
uniref:Shugoshin C-terminal domain-containing protein n=1 Tax=Chaetoceros debilis TaxID=122233 RepID=A0A7S3QDE4_9STRA|mmetsp:Transcript_25838/g.39604  ORF Transcript_25838/g.39604 Transcript_25838/m.39604 type:complete len:600 (-) Transcript_25838:1302-3101(-)